MTRTPPALAALLALATLAPAAVAAPRGKPPRTARYRYEHPALADPESLYGQCWTVQRPGRPTENHGCVRVQVARGERRAELAVADDSGLPVVGHAYQDVDRDGVLEVDERFCGSVEGLRVADGELLVWLLSASIAGPPDEPSCPGTATTGILTATFSRS